MSGYSAANSLVDTTPTPRRSTWALGDPARIPKTSSWPVAITSRLSAHSHTTNTRQSIAESARIAASSRRLFAASLSSQNPVLVAGSRNSGHPSWRCQKQPCTKMTAFHLARTMSGRPGSCLALSLKRRPACHSARRTCNSGPVSRPRILDITADRFSGLITSVMAPVSQPFIFPCI